MRVLVTGGGGFVGQWLAKALLERDDAVDLAGLGESSPSGVLSADELSRIRWLPLDVRDDRAVDEVVEQSRPDVVFHLAAVSFPPEADRAPVVTFDVNVLGTVRLLHAIGLRRASGALDPVVLVIGSAVQYGRHEESDMPLDEGAEQRPVNTYAASKVAQEVAAVQAHRATGLRVICTRSFNHSGVGQAPEYLLPSLVARVMRIARGEERCLTLGNDAVRDYLHVSDVVRAYLLLVSRGTAGEVYNVASGHGVSVRQLAADVLLRANVNAEISKDPALARSTDIPMLVGSPDRLMRDTGWAPLKTHADIIDDLLRSAHAATD
ncbi:MAG TPA: GDP-mannose 4,6-dehydratase [Gemmatimonadaceae bacterium]|nr:GDP-mannose 4,6-dehydratase [Gemmatimonadaceae bacterium]